MTPKISLNPGPITKSSKLDGFNQHSGTESNPPGLNILTLPSFWTPRWFLYRIRTWLLFWSVAMCWTGSRTPAYFFENCLGQGTCINQWSPSKIMSCQAKLDRYIFKAPKFEIAPLIGCTESFSQPLCPHRGGTPCIKRWVVWSLTYLILYSSFPGGFYLHLP